MANSLIPQELDALIRQYLTDGVLTDKERQVILRKAEGMGLDRDEIDLYLDAEVQKIDQATDATVRKRKGKTCPYCGGSVLQLTDKCPHCGENITAEASRELQEIFDNLEEALVNLKLGQDIHKSKATVERHVRKAKMYYGNNPKVHNLLEEIETETVNAEKKAKSLARNRTIITILTYNKKITAAVLFVFVGLICWGVFALRKANHEARIEAQYNTLMEQLEGLQPNETNYKEVEKELLQIKWKKIDNSDNDWSRSLDIKLKKSNVANKIVEIYEQLGLQDQIPSEIKLFYIYDE